MDKLKTALVMQENQNTYCRSWEQIWVKALSPHQVMCLRFSTTNKCKQSAHIRDNQNILKVTPNSAKASPTCPGREWRDCCQRRYQLPVWGGSRAGDGTPGGIQTLPDKTTWKRSRSGFFKCFPQPFPLPTPQMTAFFGRGDRPLTWSKAVWHFL